MKTPTPKMTDEDLRQHLVNHHGFSEAYVEIASEIRSWHRNMHTDETTRHLPHTHVEDWDGEIQFL
jgi:hypothetical protein